jgi:hypothetical protein
MAASSRPRISKGFAAQYRPAPPRVSNPKDRGQISRSRRHTVAPIEESVGQLEVSAFEAEIQPIDGIAQKEFVTQVRTLMKDSKKRREIFYSITSRDPAGKIGIDQIKGWTIQVKNRKNPCLKSDFPQPPKGARLR